MRVVFTIILALMMSAGCAPVKVPGQRDQGALQTEQVVKAQQLKREGNYAEAVETYQKIAQDHPGSEAAAGAMFEAALVLASSDNSKRDYALALTEFEEFLTHFPQHQRAPEARSWRQVLRTALDCKKENERLNKNIEKLRLLDLKQEEKRLGR